MIYFGRLYFCEQLLDRSGLVEKSGMQRNVARIVCDSNVAAALDVNVIAFR
jgi:hypothetical protein